LVVNGKLFFKEMRDLIVLYTNQCIAESIEEKNYSAERIKQSPYIKPVDRVGKICYLQQCVGYEKIIFGSDFEGNSGSGSDFTAVFGIRN